MTIELPAGYPLCWPDGWKRTAVRRNAPYRVTFAAARTGVLKSLKMLGARTDMRHPYPPLATVSANLPLRLDGLPLATAREPADPGVAIWWIDKTSGALRVMACDHWKTTRDNLRALGLALEGLRAVERSKATQILDRAMQSFDIHALPAGLPWWCGPLDMPSWPRDAGSIKNYYNAAVLKKHPDHGGSHEDFIELERAYKAALTHAVEVKRGAHG